MSANEPESRGNGFVVEPIGVVRSPFIERVDAPRQASVADGVEGRVELFAGRGLEDALTDLDQWSYIWLIFWFDRNDQGFRPKVLPPRSTKKRGVLATRAPYRPNPIGLSAVKLESVAGLTLHVRGLDLLDGTPVLDIKPYLPYSDAIPDANHGWLDQQQQARPSDPLDRYEVVASALADTQLAYLREQHAIDLWPRISAALSLGPEPHAYRRIRTDAHGAVLAVKDWRVRFRAEGRIITAECLLSGYRPRELAPGGQAPDVHREFVARWPNV
jgi:tRNA-Thr(GGU) m(6)t(6)A37 methyltransferase TsaA